MVNIDCRQGLHLLFLHGVPENRYLKNYDCFGAVLTFPDETIRGRTDALGKLCSINVAAQPTASSSKFYSNNSRDVCPAECTVPELQLRRK